MVTEEVVFAAAGAIGAAHAAHKEDGHPHRHKDGEQASIHHKPMNQTMHIQGHHVVASETSQLRNQSAIFQSAGLPAPPV
jgi:hypothetical protein